MSELPTGVYERLLTEALIGEVEGMRYSSAVVGDAEAPAVLGEHLSRAIVRALENLPADARVERANQLLADLGSPDRVVAGRGATHTHGEVSHRPADAPTLRHSDFDLRGIPLASTAKLPRKAAATSSSNGAVLPDLG